MGRREPVNYVFIVTFPSNIKLIFVLMMVLPSVMCKLWSSAEIDARQHRELMVYTKARAGNKWDVASALLPHVVGVTSTG